MRFAPLRSMSTVWAAASKRLPPDRMATSGPRPRHGLRPRHFGGLGDGSARQVTPHRQSGIYKKFRSEAVDGFVTISSKKSVLGGCGAAVLRSPSRLQKLAKNFLHFVHQLDTNQGPARRHGAHRGMAARWWPPAVVALSLDWVAIDTGTPLFARFLGCRCYRSSPHRGGAATRARRRSTRVIQTAKASHVRI